MPRMQTSNDRRGRAESWGGPSEGVDQAVQAYFGCLDRESLMDAEQERAVAERILGLRQDYWERLLGYPPFLEAMLDQIEADLAARGRKARAMAKMRRASEVLRGRPRQPERERAEAVRRVFAEELADLDPSVELADRFFADLESLDAGTGSAVGCAV